MTDTRPADERSRFRWLTRPGETITLTALEHARPPYPDPGHDPDFHAGMATDPGRFCSDLAVITSTDVAGQDVALTWTAAPYCRRGASHRTLGWNIVLTVDDGDRVVVCRRHSSLENGGLWHVSANEGAEPKDLASEGGAAVRVGAGRIVSRALQEELGLALDGSDLDAVVSPGALFEVGSGLGVLFHVPGERLGLTGADVLEAHGRASDGWEGAPQVVPLTPAALAELAPPDGWSAWALPCMLATARSSTHERPRP